MTELLRRDEAGAVFATAPGLVWVSVAAMTAACVERLLAVGCRLDAALVDAYLVACRDMLKGRTDVPVPSRSAAKDWLRKRVPEVIPSCPPERIETEQARLSQLVGILKHRGPFTAEQHLAGASLVVDAAVLFNQCNSPAVKAGERHLEAVKKRSRSNSERQAERDAKIVRKYRSKRKEKATGRAMNRKYRSIYKTHEEACLELATEEGMSDRQIQRIVKEHAADTSEHCPDTSQE
jgi:hypothetical protein